MDTCIFLRANQLFNLVNISEKSIIAFKNEIVKGIDKLISINIEKLGGLGKTIQMDEMAFKRGELVSNPTSEMDSQRDTIWIIGRVIEITQDELESGQKSRFFLKNNTR